MFIMFSHEGYEIKMTMSYHFTPTSMDKIRRQINVGDDVENLESSYIGDRNANSSLEVS